MAPPPRIKFDEIFAAWLEVTKDPQYRNKWVVDDIWHQAIRDGYPNLAGNPDFNRGNTNRAISRFDKSLDDFGETNKTGRFRRYVLTSDPSLKAGRIKRGVTFYYVTEPGTTVERPPEGDTTFFQIKEEEPEQEESKEEATTATRSISILDQDYFDSPECKKLFLGCSKSPLSVRDVLQHRIEKLRRVNKFEKAWRDVVENHDKDNVCSPYDIFVYRQRAELLCLSYIYALELMPGVTWTGVCEKACKELNRLGNEAATSAHSVGKWNRTFLSNKEHFGLTIKTRKKKGGDDLNDQDKKPCEG